MREGKGRKPVKAAEALPVEATDEQAVEPNTTTPTGRVTRLADDKPTVNEREYELWAIYNTENDGYQFSSENRDDVDRVLGSIVSRDHLRLVHRTVRTTTSSWYDEETIEPWSSPCDWNRAAGDPPEASRCSRHNWHRQDEPVPDGFVLGAPDPEPDPDGLPDDIVAFLKETYTDAGQEVWRKSYRAADEGQRDHLLQLARTDPLGT